METKEITKLLQKFFNGETTGDEEKVLKNYFVSGKIAPEFQEYKPFFNGISELADADSNPNLEDEIMNFILENENHEKTKYRRMWRTVTGIAASVIIVLGGFLLYQQQQKPMGDTFENPEDAYAYAQQTLQFVSGKYNKGMAHLSNFDKLQKANEPLKKATEPVIEFYNAIEKMRTTGFENNSENHGKQEENNDSI